MELLKGATQVTERQVSVASSSSSTKSLGKPIEKRYYTVQDICMILLSLLCLLIGILAVVDKAFAAYLGEKNQLILVGLLLSLMAACTQKQVQLFLITFETRFGASTLQNYDSILRYSMLDGNASLFLKAAIVFIFALPLALSASYKQFVSGSTVLTIDPTVVTFGPVGPPGLVEGVLSVWLNASLPFLIPNRTAYQTDPLLRQGDQPMKTGSFGFNAQIISENKTALLDAPLSYEITRLQNIIKADETLEISTYVNATICDLNSTNQSPERANPNYWRTLNQSLIQPPSIATYGTGLNFAVTSGVHDYSFTIMSLWDVRKGETFESEAVGFNLYRGQCNATWQINREGTITLKDASDCTATPQFSRPCMKNTVPKGFNATTLRGEDTLQLPLTCNSGGVPSIAVWPLYDLLWLQPVLPVWVAAVAAMAWAELAYFDGPAIWASTTPINQSAWNAAPFPFLKYQAPINLKKTVQTLHRDRGALYLVLMIQPLLLLVVFLCRVLLFSTPVSSGFGLVALLAGVSKDSLDVLRGAAFSGTLRKPVRIRISAVDHDSNTRRAHGETNIEYEIDASGRHDQVAKGRIYG